MLFIVVCFCCLLLMFVCLFTCWFHFIFGINVVIVVCLFVLFVVYLFVCLLFVVCLFICWLHPAATNRICSESA